MAPINYLPGMLISDRVFPCPRKYMLIYGHTPTPPPPATLTQEQLARDAGQLVQAHAALDKLVSDTDRNSNSLLDRIEQIAEETEEVNETLSSAGLNLKAGIVECVKTLKRRCEHHAKANSSAGAEMGKLYSKIEELKARNKRLHDAQGSGTAWAATLADVRKRLLSSFPGKTYEEARANFAGHTHEGVVDELVEALKRQQPSAVSDQVVDRLHRAAVALSCAGIPGDTLEVDKRVDALIAENKRLRGANTDLAIQKNNLTDESNRLNSELSIVRSTLSKLVVGTRTVPDMAQDVVTMNLNQRTLIEQLRDEAGKDHALDKLVQEAHRLLHKAEVSPLSGTIVERVEALIEDRDRLQRQVSAGDLLLHKAVNDAHLLLDKAGIPGGRIDERVRVAIERRQEAKPKPWSVSLCSVMHADGNRRIHCTSRELAEQTCEILNRQEAR